MSEKNKELAYIFSRIADALELKGESSFRIIAYRKAARVLEDLTEDIEVITKKGKLREIPGVGEGIAKKIEEYLKTGKMKKYEEALSGIPEGLLELLEIQNLGAKTISLAHKELGVKNLDDLKRVIEDGSLAKLFGMGEKKVENIKKGIEIYEQAHERIPIYEALTIVEDVIEYLKNAPGISQISPAGSLRRMKETVGDIDILATGKNGREIIEFFTKYPNVDRVIASGKTKGSIMVKTEKGKKQVDLRIVDEDCYGAALQYFTGSKAHNIRLRSMAKEKGLKISEYGVFRDDKKIAGRTEEEIYKILNLPWIPPEIREDRGEIECALENRLPDLINYTDIKGDLHVHSSYSDGHSTIEEIAEHAKSLGYEYIAICDHSQSVKYAHGLTEDRLKRQIEEIDKLNEKLTGIKILKGIEVDILPDGKLDFPDELLAQLDYVVASIHIGFKKNVTERMLLALENPYVHTLAHPTGRLISKREGYDVDLDKIFEAALKNNKILELNAYYDRLDLNEINLRKAKEMGIKIAIGTDAHHIGGMRMMRFGIGIARRGWLEKKDVLNCLPYSELKKILRK
ncbi:DNA polymerase/3'-5' exonuclease PolX [SCandidatus Aminicenantes bacterium Aminicenantia_JdfR_composite]|jgi:DNA polymerase (family 10)|nr:DNA polymerase/3'-5' exonuclease PolX [SCandidatus Aminicenantes bacterium Aminicenantia_JdfR_composite]